MKRWICLLLVVVMVLSLGMTRRENADLSTLGQTQLNSLVENIEEELERNHKVSSTARGGILDVTKKTVEAYFSNQGVEVSWAWTDYTYTRDWDFYTLTTHISYKVASGKNQKQDVYSEVMYIEGKYNLFYLSIGQKVILNHRDNLPPDKWASTPETNVNEASGINLALLSETELHTLSENAKNELSENHTTSSKATKAIRTLVKNTVDAHYTNQGFDTSWPWLDYTYTCDWNYYTMTSTVTLESETDDSSRTISVYAEAYPLSELYELTYLFVGEDVLIDRRSEIPKSLNLDMVERKDKYELGATISFGRYLQRIDTYPEPVLWEITKKDETGTKALLVAKSVLDAQPYHSEEVDISYADCALRAWLNNDFYNTCFNDEEKACIVQTTIFSGEEKLTDRVFLPSLAEVFPNGSTVSQRRGRATYYAYINGVRGYNETHYNPPVRSQRNFFLYENGNGHSENHNYCCWFVRTQHFNDATIVNGWGETETLLTQFYDTYTVGVRPAIWISIK